MKLALIDGDIVAYSGAAAANRVTYITPDGKDHHYKKDAVAHCRSNDLDESSITKIEELDPVEFAFSNAKKIIDKIIRQTECQDYKVILSGPENFRKEVCASYKANRDESKKPVYLEAVKDYLIQHHDAITSSSKLEADDFIGMEAGEDSVICTLDKDLDQIVGWHYNWSKDTLYYVTSNEADLFFWMQMLMGDRADNIQGIPGIGERTAMKLLEDVSQHRRKCIVGLEYAKHFDDPEEVFKTNAQLLWIQR